MSPFWFLVAWHVANGVGEATLLIRTGVGRLRTVTLLEPITDRDGTARWTRRSFSACQTTPASWSGSDILNDLVYYYVMFRCFLLSWNTWYALCCFLLRSCLSPNLSINFAVIDFILHREPWRMWMYLNVSECTEWLEIFDFWLLGSWILYAATAMENECVISGWLHMACVWTRQTR